MKDQELAKALSEVGAEVGPEAGLELLASFGVTRANLLPVDVRQEFLDRARALVEGA